MKLSITEKEAFNIIGACKTEIKGLAGTQYEDCIIQYGKIIEKIEKQLNLGVK